MLDYATRPGPGDGDTRVRLPMRSLRHESRWRPALRHPRGRDAPAPAHPRARLGHGGRRHGECGKHRPVRVSAASRLPRDRNGLKTGNPCEIRMPSVTSRRYGSFGNRAYAAEIAAHEPPGHANFV